MVDSWWPSKENSALDHDQRSTINQKTPVSSNLHRRRLENNVLKTKRVLKRREEGVTGDFAFDQGQKEIGTFWQQLRVKLRPADQEKLATLTRLA